MPSLVLVMAVVPTPPDVRNRAAASRRRSQCLASSNSSNSSSSLAGRTKGKLSRPVVWPTVTTRGCPAPTAAAGYPPAPLRPPPPRADSWATPCQLEPCRRRPAQRRS